MKWPKTMHLPSSPGLQNDDRRIENLYNLLGQEVVITEKLDGENTSFHSDKAHARSIDGKGHPSRTWVKALHGTVRHLIPSHIQIVGENMYAKHSIFYDRLSTYFYLFGVIDKERDVLLSFDETGEWAKKLGLEVVPILYSGIFREEFVMPERSFCGDKIEGYVVRLAREIKLDEYHRCVAKFVRKGHVQTDIFWHKNWIPNKLFNG